MMAAATRKGRMADRSAASREREWVLAALADGEQRTATDLTFCVPAGAKRIARACKYLFGRGKLKGGPATGWYRPASPKPDGE